MRPKLSIPAQINDMKKAGITFDIVSEAEAKQYLEYHTYYFRIKAYAKNYDKYANTAKQGQYINLEFAYLMDLSQIDSLLRKIILEISHDLEYYLRVKLLADFQMVDEDGYEIVQELFKMQPSIVDTIDDRGGTSLCSDLVASYRGKWSIWNIVEVLSLGQFTHLYSLFYQRNKFRDTHVSLLLPVNKIRNAAAHGNCLLNHFRPPYTIVNSPCYDVRNEIMQHVGVTKVTLDKRLSHPVIHDFAALLFLYTRLVPSSARLDLCDKLKTLFEKRILEHGDYYEKNEVLKACYDFTRKVVDFYC
jgi:abortive infection bacteriophage resistance protein